VKKLLFPNLYLESIHKLDFQRLKNKGIKAIIVDIDNTLVSWDSKYAPQEVVDWLDHAKKEGFDLCIVSNNTKDRVVTFSENLKIPAIHAAIKPRNKPFYRAMDIMKSKPSNTAIIGDQIFTDVLGGNRLGLFTILVVPVGQKEHFWTYVVRKVERRVLANFLKDKEDNWKS
jgi:uncharacterized protein